MKTKTGSVCSTHEDVRNVYTFWAENIKGVTLLRCSIVWKDNSNVLKARRCTRTHKCMYENTLRN
jgi:hypothetical protein